MLDVFRNYKFYGINVMKSLCGEEFTFGVTNYVLGFWPSLQTNEGVTGANTIFSLAPHRLLSEDLPPHQETGPLRENYYVQCSLPVVTYWKLTI